MSYEIRITKNGETCGKFITVCDFFETEKDAENHILKVAFSKDNFLEENDEQIEFYQAYWYRRENELDDTDSQNERLLNYAVDDWESCDAVTLSITKVGGCK